MGAELGNLAGGFFAYVNRDRDHSDERAGENKGHQPGRDVADTQCPIKCTQTVHGMLGVQKNLGYPRHQNENENENVIPFQSPSDRLEFANLEAGQNQVFADQLLPFALKQIPIFHNHGHEEMRLEHANARAEGVIEPVPTRLDPEHYPDDGEIEKEDDVRHFASGKRDRNDGSAAGDGPIGGDVEPLAPDHDASHFAPIKVRHRVDVTRIIKAALQRDRCLFGRHVCCLFSCHGC